MPDILLATFVDETTAETAIGRLRAARIAARIEFEPRPEPGRVWRDPGVPASRYRVFVPAADAARARRLLRQARR